MTTDITPPCANCQRLQAEVDALRAELEALRAVVAQLQRQLAAARKDSSNSSKPPSSDIVKPPKPPPPPGQERRTPGGQPGHPAHQRELFPPERLASRTCSPRAKSAATPGSAGRTSGPVRRSSWSSGRISTASILSDGPP